MLLKIYLYTILTLTGCKEEIAPVVEAEPSSIDKSKPLFIQCSTEEKQPLTLKADVYAVKY